MSVVIILVLCLWPTQVHADGEDQCNNFERIQSIILSEATSQPLETQVEVARVAITKGACYLDENFYTGYASALFNLTYRRCVDSWHCRAYFMMDTIDARVREQAALAAHIALTEEPRMARYHFDAAIAPMAYWWDSPKACPHTFGRDSDDSPKRWFISGELRIC